MATGLTVLGILLLCFACSAQNAIGLRSLLHNGEQRGRLPERDEWAPLAVYLLAGSSVFFFLPALWSMLAKWGALSTAFAFQGPALFVFIGVSVLCLLICWLVRLPVSPWQVVMSNAVGVGIVAYLGFTHVDRFLWTLIPVWFVGPLLAYAIAALIKQSLLRLSDATHFCVYNGTEPFSVVPRRDNPLTSLWALEAVRSDEKNATNLRERAKYRQTQAGAMREKMVRDGRDAGLFLHFAARGVFDFALAAVVVQICMPMSAAGSYALVVACVVAGFFVTTHLAAGRLVALSGRPNVESTTAANWSSGLVLILGMLTGSFVDPNQSTAGAFAGVGQARGHEVSRPLNMWFAWLAVCASSAALAGATMYLLGRMGI